MSILLAAAPDSIRAAVCCIDNGEVVGLPTETLYGLAVDALDEGALARLAQVKGRPEGHPFPLLVSDERMLESLVETMPSAARRLAQCYWPGPLTLVLPAGRRLPRAVRGPGGSVGVRLAVDPVALELVRRFGGPVTATSANRSGASAAIRAGQALLRGVSMVLDDGPRQAPPSTVVAVPARGAPRLLRQGALTLRPQELEA